MRLLVCESQVLILEELQRANTVAYFRTDVNNPLARFAPHGGSADRCAPGWRRLCRCCLPLCFPSSLLPRLRTLRRWALWRQGLVRHCAPAGCAWDGRVGGPQQQRQVALVAGGIRNARAGQRSGELPPARTGCTARTSRTATGVWLPARAGGRARRASVTGPARAGGWRMLV